MSYLSSCIYSGLVTHERFKPKKHFFSYKTFSLLIDLNEIEDLEKKIKFFSYNKFNILSFYSIDHGNRDGSSLIKWVKNTLKKSKINFKLGKIKLLCYPRFFGYVFNPLSIFYCYDKNLNLKVIFYEVKNTFNEQHTYLFRCLDSSNLIVISPIYKLPSLNGSDSLKSIIASFDIFVPSVLMYVINPTVSPSISIPWYNL